MMPNQMKALHNATKAPSRLSQMTGIDDNPPNAEGRPGVPGAAAPVDDDRINGPAAEEAPHQAAIKHLTAAQGAVQDGDQKKAQHHIGHAFYHIGRMGEK